MSAIDRALRRKYIVDSAILFVGCAIGVFAFCWFRTWIVGELDTSQFRQIVDLLPNDWRKFASVDFDWLVSYLGRTSLTLDEPMLVLFVCLWCIVRGSDVVSGEISRGTMEMLLAQPVSRQKVYWTHALYTLLGLTALVALTWLGMAIGIWTTVVEETTYPVLSVPLMDYKVPLTFMPPKVESIAMASQVDPLDFLPGVLNLFCLGVFLCGLSAWCSAWDRYRWRTLGILTAIYFVAAMLKIVGMASETWWWCERISFFGCYSPAASIEMGTHEGVSSWSFFTRSESGKIVDVGPLINFLILAVLGVLFYLWGARIFKRRDLPAPV